MTLEEIFESEYTIPVILIGFIVFTITTWWQLANIQKKIYGDSSKAPVKTVSSAKIVAFKTTPPPLSITMVVVEFENNRRELAASSTTLQGLIEGDEGVLTYQGKRLIRFRRSIEK